MSLTRTLPGLVLGLAAGAAAAQDDGFADGFEPVTAMRMSDLALRDPHVYVNAIFSCADVTDTPLLGVSLNGTIRARIQIDEDGDGWVAAGAIGNRLRNAYPDFDQRTYGYAKLSDLIRATGRFEVDSKGPGGMRIRDRA